MKVLRSSGSESFILLNMRQTQDARKRNCSNYRKKTVVSTGMTVTSQQTSQFSGVKLQEVDFSWKNISPGATKSAPLKLPQTSTNSVMVCNFWGEETRFALCSSDIVAMSTNLSRDSRPQKHHHLSSSVLNHCLSWLEIQDLDLACPGHGWMRWSELGAWWYVFVDIFLTSHLTFACFFDLWCSVPLPLSIKLLWTCSSPKCTLLT